MRSLASYKEHSIARKNQHAVRSEDAWAVRAEHNTRDTSHHGTQADAIDATRNIARSQRSEVVFHDRQGRIRDRDSGGRDPNPSTDRVH